MRIDDIVRRNADVRGIDPAFTCDGETFSWARIHERTSQLANLLRGRGLRDGDRAAILATNCHRYFEFHFACAKAGLIGVPLNPRLIGPELAYILGDAGAGAIVADAGHAATVREVIDQLSHLGTSIGYGADHGLAIDYETGLAGESADDPAASRGSSDLNVIAYTSGTTGRPKGAMHTHHFSTISALSYALFLGIGADDRALATMPAYVYRGGSAGFGTCLAGAHTFVAPFEPRSILDLIEKNRLTYSMFAPAMISMLLRQPDIADRDLSSMRNLWTGGAPISEETLEQIIGVFGDVVGAVYGMTEATSIAQIKHRGDGDRRRLLSVGRPMPLLDVRILTPDGEASPAGEVGEITVRGDTVMAGYWNDPDRTVDVLRDGWFSTGDMGYLDDDGYLYLVDRRKDIINSGGINVYSIELENVLALMPGVAEAAVVGVPDDEWGEAVMAFVVTEEGRTLTSEQIVAHCREHLAGYKKPRRVVFVDELPRSAMGKVDKKALREPYWAGHQRRVHG